jgi:geranylgeranyl diphosphate synthase type II
MQPRIALLEAGLDRFLPAADSYPSHLHAAMRYVVIETGGKRLRPLLCMAAAEICGATSERVLPAACAVEMIHAFSLVHDDLPGMDNDVLRRGKPTCHIAFDEPTAILAGDALLVRAFATLARQMPFCSPEQTVRALQIVTEAVGSEGMAGGQAMDLAAENGDWDAQTLAYIHANKTGALIRVALQVGAIFAGGTAAQIEALGVYGDALGHLFQIVDDLLNETGAVEQVGKPVGTDRARNKATYPQLLGVEGARQEAQKIANQALAALAPFDAEATPLRAMALWALDRNR